MCLQQPADECKRIHVGDVLLRVDGVDVVGKEASAIEKLIAGPYGSPVSLTLQSDHDNERRSVRLARKETLTGSFVKDSSVSLYFALHLSISLFPAPLWVF
jgi:C-terminal processing protease CtpA/Prc